MKYKVFKVFFKNSDGRIVVHDTLARSNAIVNYYVTRTSDNNTKILNGTLTIYMTSRQIKTVEVDFKLYSAGNYTFYASVVSFAEYPVEENLAFETFVLNDIYYDWLITEKNLMLVFIGVLVIVLIALAIKYVRK